MLFAAVISDHASDGGGGGGGGGVPSMCHWQNRITFVHSLAGERLAGKTFLPRHVYRNAWGQCVKKATDGTGSEQLWTCFQDTASKTFKLADVACRNVLFNSSHMF